MYKPEPLPINEPVNDPVLYDDVNEFKELVDDSMEFNLNSWLLSIIAIDDERAPILELIEPLNVEYPVVPVIWICDEPDTNGVVSETIVPVVIKEPVISVLEFILTFVPLSVMLLSFKCSTPLPFGKRFNVK